MSVEAAMVAAVDSAYRKLPHAFGQMTPQRIMGLPVAQAVPISLRTHIPLSAAPVACEGKAESHLPSAHRQILHPPGGTQREGRVSNSIRLQSTASAPFAASTAAATIFVKAGMICFGCATDLHLL